MITVGQITKPQGVRGEVKVKPLTDDPSRFYVLKSATVDGKAYKISGVRVAGNDVFIKFAGIDSRDGAELLRGKFIIIERVAAVPLEDGEFFIADLLGARLIAKYADGDKKLGTIKSVQSFGSADVITVCSENGKEMTFAFVRALEANFDADKKELSVNGRILDGVAVYDED